MEKTLSSGIISALQTAIGPVILISGVGLLLLSMTNRLGRAIDRARGLASVDSSKREQVKNQLEILYYRAKILRWAILLAAVSALCSGMLVISLFISVLTQIDLGWLIGGIFIISMLALIGSLVIFIQDVNKSLEALRLELK
jgi:hypothetical protein